LGNKVFWGLNRAENEHNLDIKDPSYYTDFLVFCINRSSCGILPLCASLTGSSSSSSCPLEYMRIRNVQRKKKDPESFLFRFFA